MAIYDEYSDLPKGLLLCNYKLNQGSVTIESINSFIEHCEYPVFPYSMEPGFSDEFPYDTFDFIIIHYSIIPNLAGYISEAVKRRLKSFNGPIMQFIQDPYRDVDSMQKFMKDVGVTTVFSVVPEETCRSLYNQLPDLKIKCYLTGYASSLLNLEKTIPLEKRKIFVGYRGREYPYWFGSTINEKVDAAKKIKNIFSKQGLKTNISTREKDRVYGRDWVKFLRECRAIYGTESSIDYIDRTGAVSVWYAALEDLNKKKLETKKWDGRQTLETEFFKDKSELAPKGMNVIPPRVMETMSLRSLAILIEGEYSGVIEPWRHYVPIKKDLSNIDEVIEFMKDDDKVSSIIATAFAEIANNRKYMWQGFGDFLNESFAELTSKKNITLPEHLYPYSYLREKAGSFYHIPNPHQMTVYNPKNKNLTVVAKKLIRPTWRKILGRIRGGLNRS